MSYIRCLSNPEGLYIIGTRDNKIEIMHSVKPPLSSKWGRAPGCRIVGKGPKSRIVATRKMYDVAPTIIVPAKVFHETCRIWFDGREPDKGTSRGGFRVREIHVYTDTGKPVPARWADDILKRRRGRNRETAFLIRLSYKGQFVFLWRVTWLYVCHHGAERRHTLVDTLRERGLVSGYDSSLRLTKKGVAALLKTPKKRRK